MQDENSPESAVTRKMLLATLLLQLKKMCEKQHELGGRQRPGDQTASSVRSKVILRSITPRS